MKRIHSDLIPGGRGDGMPDSRYNALQLLIGIIIETEHTRDLKKCKEIAKDHLTEDPHYYTRLLNMEMQAKLQNILTDYMSKTANAKRKEFCAEAVKHVSMGLRTT